MRGKRGKTLRTKPAHRASKVDSLGQKIRSALTPELLKEEYLDNPRPFAGHCYVASEAYYHLKGGKSSGLKAMGIEHEGSQHWWLMDRKTGQIIDLTAEQFISPVPYAQGKGRGFLTRDPSKRAQVVIDRVNKTNSRTPD